MLGWLLGLLQFLGIFLAVLFVLLLAIVLMVLFVPLRYELFVFYDKAPVVDLSLTWLFALAEFSLHYDKETSLSTAFRIAWKDLTKGLDKEREEAKETEEGFYGDEDKLDGMKRTADAFDWRPPPADRQDAAVSDSETVKMRPQKAIAAGKAAVFARIRTVRKRLWKKCIFLYNRTAEFLKTGKNFYRLIADLLHRVFLFLLSRLKKLIVYSIPKKFKGKFRFGFSDPYTTGQVLSYLSLLYHPFQKDLVIIPEFEREVVEIEASVKGRFGLYYLVYILSSILLNKDCRLAYKRLKSGRIFV